METATATATPLLRTKLRHFVTQAVAEAELEADLSVEEATRRIVKALGLQTTSPEDGNNPQLYELYVHRADGTSEALRPTIRIGDAVGPGEILAPLPEVTPGAHGSPRA